MLVDMFYIVLGGQGLTRIISDVWSPYGHWLIVTKIYEPMLTAVS